MKLIDFKSLIQDIVKGACELKDKYTDQIDVPVNYACIFTKDQEEYDLFISLAQQIGERVKETNTGPLWRITPLSTIAGELQILKVRAPDKTRLERGDADFTLSDYPAFKRKYLQQRGFTLITRADMEMIEIYDKNVNYRVYFSFPTLDKQLNIT